MEPETCCGDFATLRQRCTRGPLCYTLGSFMSEGERIRPDPLPLTFTAVLASAHQGQTTCTPLVPDVMLNFVLMLYQPPTKMALLMDDDSPK
jgi:hypothetical protein